MSLNRLAVTSKIHHYDVHFAETAEFVEEINQIPGAVFIIDQCVWDLHADAALLPLKRRNDLILLSVSEETKDLGTVQELYDELLKRSPNKHTTVISIGGGITQDVSGFTVSTLFRGLRWRFVPTTLLAQADSCIGSKTSLNYQRYKNLIGTFYPPHSIYICPSFLKTQQRSDYYSGLGEVIKLHLMGGKDQTDALIASLPSIVRQDDQPLLKAIQTSLLVKLGFMEGDEFDQGKRNMLNYGHCFGHAIESATGFAVPHGQSVLLGMILANRVAVSRGRLTTGTERFWLSRLLLPVLQPELRNIVLDDQGVIEAMKRDKKRIGSLLPLIMITDKHEMMKADDLTEAEVGIALNEVRDILRQR